MKTCLSILAMVALLAVAAETPKPATSAKLSLTTKPTGKKYSPKHVIAIWVTDSKGKFVKTLEVYGKKRRKYLKVWTANSKENTVDAVTGATLKKHQTHTVTWDCRDAKGKLVADGEYLIHVEFTEENKQGPRTPAKHIQFKKGETAVSLTPKDLSNFVKIKLDYTPPPKPEPPKKDDKKK